MNSLRALLIAPEPPGAAGLPRLEWVEEVAQIGELEGVDLAVLSGPRATRSAIGARLGNANGVGALWDVVLWVGHGAPGRLLAADGPISAEWLACMMRQAPPGVVLLSACYSGQRDESLHSLAESLSQSSINCVGMWVSVLDRAAVVYDVEFMRAYAGGGSLAVAHRVAVAQVAMEWPAMAGAAFMLPGLANGYGKIEKRLGAIEQRLGAVEQKLDRLSARS